MLTVIMVLGMCTTVSAAGLAIAGKNFREENAGATRQAAKDIVNCKSD